MANYDVESHTHTWYRRMFCFLFLAPYARTTRYEEAFFSLENQGKKRLASLARLMIIYPKNSCDSRPPLGLRRPHGGSTPFPHSSPMTCRRKNWRRRTTRRAGASRASVCSVPGVAGDLKNMEIPVSLQLGLYQRIYVLLYSAVLL